MTPDTPHPTVPAPIGAALARLPAYPGSMLLVTALNLVLARQLPNDVTQLLQGKRFRIEVRDARLSFDFVWRGGMFRPVSPQAASPDLTLSANAHDFVRLARRLDDPDTLFFNRRLSMQGDTELGLVVKNALDAMELPVLDLAAWKPSAVLAIFKRTPRPSRMPSFHERH
jgi:O2-independent ubiquinone biosynthesis accessory factor UbiT